jgi:hypothetical protein
MQIQVEVEELRPLVEQIVAEVLRMLPAPADNRIAYTEPEAAAMLGLPRHVLRDCRLRGEITGRRVGKRVIYGRQVLMSFLASEAERDAMRRRRR